jgi:hypothetical protein
MMTPEPEYSETGRAISVVLLVVLILWGCAAVRVIAAVVQWLRIYG